MPLSENGKSVREILQIDVVIYLEASFVFLTVTETYYLVSVCVCGGRGWVGTKINGITQYDLVCSTVPWNSHL